eukprot:746400-Rhodomonas_salina.2
MAVPGAVKVFALAAKSKDKNWYHPMPIREVATSGAGLGVLSSDMVLRLSSVRDVRYRARGSYSGRDFQYWGRVWCRAVLRTGMVFAIHGTEDGYGGTRQRHSARGLALLSGHKGPILLRSPYAMSGTDTGYAATPCSVLTEAMLLRRARP